jgi:hypothetical protein
MRFRSRLRIVRAHLALVLVCSAFAAACSRDGQGSGPPAASARPAASALAPWSRSESAASEKDSGPPPAGATIDPTALDEILAAAPKKALSATGEDGSSAVGTDTGLKPGDKGAEEEPKEPVAPPPANPAPSGGKVSFGPLSIQGEMASASIEREARAQLYWGLVQRCRDKDGSTLPPDVVTIQFRIDEDGFIIGSSINATPSKPVYEDAAHCMRRELSAATFRAPVGVRGLITVVTMTVPSID